jgi:formate hydrogenlyase subunit 3/multisubunit Na+/H+ antiporter MnhD subunit
MRGRSALLTPGAQTAVVALMLAAFGSKAGLVPMHVWLPRAHPAAPSHISALMSAAMVKLGVYGVMRVLFDLMPPVSPWWGGGVLALGVVTALTGVLYSVAETHLKRILAYSTIENIGLIFVAVGVCAADAQLRQRHPCGHGPWSSRCCIRSITRPSRASCFSPVAPSCMRRASRRSKRSAA